MSRPLQTNFTAGEWSPRLDGHPDLAKYFNACKTLENFLVFRHGGVTRRPGTRFISEVKTSSKKTILIPFIVNRTTAYQLEVGDLYIRFYKNSTVAGTTGARIENPPGTPVEIVSPYTETDLPNLQVRKSVDVMYITHPNYNTRKLSRVSDTSWVLTSVTFTPPPSVEANTDLAQLGAPNANSGNGKKFRAKGSPFLAGDKGRQIISGAGRAVITAVDSVDQISMDILDPFAATITALPNSATISNVSTTVTSTAHGLSVDNFVVATSGTSNGDLRRVVTIIDANSFTVDAVWSAAETVTMNKVIAFASGAWLLTSSPQTTLDPNIKEPIGAQITLVAGAAAFRSNDVGKFIKIYGGVIKLTIFDSTIQMRGQILSILSKATTADPVATSAGSWTLEVEAWSTSQGFPACVEFATSRLAFARTVKQPTTWWESAVDDYENMAIGKLADDALEYTIASRELNAINWLVSDVNLFIGTEGNEYLARGPGIDQPLGGDVIPYVAQQSTMGSQASQALSTSEGILFVDRSGLIVCHLVYNFEREKFVPIETTLFAEHITKPGLIQAPLVYQQKPDSLLWLARTDGVGLACTFYRLLEDVTAWGRHITDGSFESFSVIPHPNGDRDQLWAIVKRTINGVTKRYVEYFEDGATEFATRAWHELYTDCVKAGTIFAGATTIAGLSHLEAKTVDVVIGGSFVGPKIVSGGQITGLEAPIADATFEVGLHYNSTLVTMRPAIPGVNIEGIPRRFTKCFARLLNSFGGKINGELIQYPAAPLGTVALFTGDRDILNLGTDTEGRITITQDQPYPMTVLALFGELEVGSRG